jgi:hypothetical protein
MFKPILQVNLFELELVSGYGQDLIKKMALGSGDDPVFHESVGHRKSPTCLQQRKIAGFRNRLGLHFVSDIADLRLDFLDTLFLSK